MLNLDQNISLISMPDNIRNVFVLCLQYPLKLALMDTILKRVPSSIHLEERKTNEPKSTPFPCRSISYEYKSQQTGITKPHLINLLCSVEPIHFASDLISNITIADGTLLLIDCVGGLSVSLDDMLKRTLAEKVRPALVISNIYRCISKFEQDPESIYQQIEKVIESVNLCISTSAQAFGDGDIVMSPVKGNVAFDFGKGFIWGFTISQFAALYSKKLNIDAAKLSEKFWGDHFYNPQTKTWTSQRVTEDSKTLNRGFVEFIMKPIMKVTQCVLAGGEEQILKMTASLQIALSPEQAKLQGTSLLKVVLSSWINSAESLLDMIVMHLPSPLVAQKYRTSILYDGPQYDECAKTMRECNPKGPLMMYVSRMVPSDEKGKFYGFGRVFSGTIQTGQNVGVIGFTPIQKKESIIGIVEEALMIKDGYTETVTAVQCGNIVSLVMDKLIFKAATICDIGNITTIRRPQLSYSSLFKIPVYPKAEKDLPKLMDSLKLMIKSDPLVTVQEEESGELLITGVDEHHVKTCLNDLQNKFAFCDIMASDTFTTYKEIVTQTSQICLSKSANKHNRLYCTAQPLADTLAEFLVKEQETHTANPKYIADKLCEDFGWTTEEVNRIWAFGPDLTGPNMFVEMTKDASRLNEIREPVKASFQWATKEGVLCEENMRGVRVNLLDAVLHVGRYSNTGGQIIPTARRVVYACELTAEPRLMEPCFLREIVAPEADILKWRQQILNSRGIVLAEEPIFGKKSHRVVFFHPAIESAGFESLVEGYSLNGLLSEPIFSHWEVVDSDPLVINSYANNIVTGIRKRKGLKETIRPLEEFLDKL